MCASDSHSTTPSTTSHRRTFLRLSVASGIAALSSQLLSTNAIAQQTDKSPPKPGNIITPQEAKDRLIAGNKRYAEGVTKRHDFLHEREPLATGQNPFAAILSCADSRIAPEYAFDSARGDLFVVRVAGNFVSNDGLGSLEYAVAVLQTPLLMVLGHESCGAVKAAIESQKDNKKFPGNIQLLADAIAPSVKKVLTQGDIFNASIRQNVIDNIEKLKTGSPIISDAVDQKKLMIIGGVYKLATGKIELV